MSISLLLLSTTDEVWDQFAGFYKYRKLAVPPRPRDGIWVGTETGELIGGICLYPCEDAPYVMVEHVAARPLAPPRLVYAAMQLGILQLVAYGTTRHKILVCFPREEFAARALERFGFQIQKSVVYTMWPGGVPIGSYEPKVREEPTELTGGEDEQESAPPTETLPEDEEAGKNLARPRRKR